MQRWRRVVTSAVLVLGGACDCRSCGEVAVAELTKGQGIVERDFAVNKTAWQPAQLGASFSFGDGLRTNAGSSAEVTFAAGGGLVLKSDTTIRFLEEAGLTVETGEAEIEASKGRIYLSTRIGMATIEPGSRVEAERTKDGVSINVLIGEAIFEQQGKEPVRVAEGRGVQINIKEAVLERNGEPPATKIDEADAGVSDASSSALLVQAEGRGVKWRAPKEEKWHRLQPKQEPTELDEGSEVRLPRKANLAVQRGEEQLTIRGPAEAILGGDEQQPRALARTKRGGIGAEAKEKDTVLRVPGGTIVVKAPRGKAKIEIDRKGHATVTAERGEVGLEGEDKETLVFGETAILSEKGKIRFSLRMPKVADLTIVAGESAAIHDPQGQSAVRIRLVEACPKGALVELARGNRSFAKARIRTRGKESIVPVRSGRYRYRVRCLEDERTVKERGTIRVLRDSGRVRLPPDGPKNTLEADGRRYTVLYQNVLPRFTFRWSDAPKDTSYRLKIEGVGTRGRDKEVKTKRPSVDLRITEGTYRWWFSTTSKRIKSADTTLVLDFDNAAPAAYLQQPPVDARSKEPTIQVAGAAMKGATVSVGGTPLPLDRHHRFSAQVPIPSKRVLAVRIEHGRHGVHFYLRRIEGP